MNARNIWAIVLIVLGVGFLFGQLGMWQFGSVIFTWWPLLIMGFGVHLITRKNGSYVFGGFVLLVGIIFQGLELDIFPGSFWSYFWPLTLILIGISLITSKARKSDGNRDSSDCLDEFVIFGGIKRNLNTNDFKGGNASAFFGGVEADLRDAKLSGGFAELDLTCAFGGIELKVPENWHIDVIGTPILGGIENKTIRNYQDDEVKPILKIKATAMFGGIEIRN